jgi:hypothetical protein
MAGDTVAGTERSAMSKLAKAKVNNDGTDSSKPALSSDLDYKLPDPEEMIEQINKEMKQLKLEAKKLFDEMEGSQRELEKAIKEATQERKKAQKRKIKGNELMKLEHLAHLGFDEDVIQDHIEKENKKLEKALKGKQKDVKNVEGNIEKMISMNRQAEMACTAAQGAYNQLIVTHSKLQTSLENAELALYAAESRVKHKRNMRSVEITSKDGFKKGLKVIVKEVKNRCDDDTIVRKVLTIAGKCLSSDIGMANNASDYGDGSSSSGSSVSVSSASTDSE